MEYTKPLVEVVEISLHDVIMDSGVLTGHLTK